MLTIISDGEEVGERPWIVQQTEIGQGCTVCRFKLRSLMWLWKMQFQASSREFSFQTMGSNWSSLVSPHSPWICTQFWTLYFKMTFVRLRSILDNEFRGLETLFYEERLWVGDIFSFEKRKKWPSRNRITLNTSRRTQKIITCLLSAYNAGIRIMRLSYRKPDAGWEKLPTSKRIHQWKQLSGKVNKCKKINK